MRTDPQTPPGDPSIVCPDRTARQLGFRLPAEWEPIDRVWVTRPHNRDTWPGCLDAAQQQFDGLVQAMRSHVRVCETGSLGIATNDSWIRDYGPIFVTHPAGRLACHSFAFNCWGDKYQPYDDDNQVPPRIASRLQIPMWQHEMVLEGGSIEVNGAGTVMTTRQCLLNPNRNPALSQDDLEQRLHDALGTHHVIWLPGGIRGDDTDGHIDDVARFVGPNTVAAVRTQHPHPDAETLEHNWRALEQARDQDGRRLQLVELPVPDPICYDFPPEGETPGGPQPLPASYANFLITNQAVFVPTFGQHHDDVALRRLEQAMPGYQAIGVRCDRLIVGLGAIHCLTMQQPAGATPTRVVASKQHIQ